MKNTAPKFGTAYLLTQRGLTLIEMMTALVIGSVLLAGLTQVFVASRQGYKLSESLGYLQESGRLALYAISDDLRRAGYWGGNADYTSFSGGTVALVTPTAALFNTCPTGATTWAMMLQQRAFGLDDTAGSYACIPSSGAGKYLRGDVVVARFADTQQQTAANMAASPNALFMRTSLLEGRVFVGSAESNVLNQVSASNGPFAAYAVMGRGYYVGTDGSTCESVSVPSLYRIALNSSGAPTVQNIIAGVEDLQIQWGLDSDGDGIPNQYLDASDLATANWNWPGYSDPNTVISARVWVLTRSECPDPTYTNDQTYEYGSKVGTAKYAPGDHYRRQLYSATVALRN